MIKGENILGYKISLIEIDDPGLTEDWGSRESISFFFLNVTSIYRKLIFV
jgi:hypothetical protein